MSLRFDPNIDEEADILAIRAKCMTNLKKGTIVTSWVNENTSVGKIVAVPTQELFDATTVYLQEKNPALYGYRVTQCQPGFM